jgi:hypothetical protein
MVFWISGITSAILSGLDRIASAPCRSASATASV